MIKFTIFVLTYNRHELLQKTLNSIFAQTYADYEVLLYDNGSTPSAESIAKRYCDSRLFYWRSDTNIHMCDIAEDSLNRMNGTHFLFLADDDVLVPHALEFVANVFARNADIEVLQVGFVSFSHSEKIFDAGRNNLVSFTGGLDVFDAVETAFNCFDAWGIGPGSSYRAPRMAHSSGFFISKSLIARTRLKQKELFIKPFGDIGYTGALLNTDKIYFLDLPLAVIGEATTREMNGSLLGQRHKWDREIQFLEHTPLKSASFLNMGADGHLKVIFRNGVNKLYDSRLRPSFYYTHLKYVISDSPWDFKTLKDLIFGISHMLISMYRFFSLRKFVSEVIRLLIALFALGGKFLQSRNMPLPSESSMHKNDIDQHKTFDNIEMFAKWLDENHVKSRVSNSLSARSVN